MGELATQGKAVIFVSSYLPELLGVCDTIGVMCRGVLSANVPSRMDGAQHRHRHRPAEAAAKCAREQ
jgi:ABC-type sugar transport system ATPase subunit